jgi:hypothetical protein
MNNYHTAVRLCVVGAILVATTLWTPAFERPQAQSLPSTTPAGIRMAVSNLGPLTAREILPDTLYRELLRQKRFSHWDVPGEENWPMKPTGRPKVETERTDTLYHTVDERSVYRIRHMYRLSRQQLRALNPDVDLDDVSTGDRLEVWERSTYAVPTSYGSAHGWGRLYDGEPLPDSPNYEILFQHRTFGTHYTVSEVKRTLDAYYRAYPDADPLIVGDISFRRGGQMSPHVSHRSGRDVDITYPRTDEIPNYDRFHWMSHRDLAVEKALYFIKTLVDGGYVHYMFMDHHFQRRLYRAAEARGAPQKWLDAVFEYPSWGGEAIIRHEPGHDTHVHIRFRCQSTDRRCR